MRILALIVLAALLGGGGRRGEAIAEPMPATPNATTAAAEAAARPDGAAGTLATLSTCKAADKGCVCVDLPARPDVACWDRGERWSHGGCRAATSTAPAAQCCDGRWQAGGGCGACSCTASWADGGCIAVGDAVPSCAPPYQARIERIDPALERAMRASTWRPGCPVPLRSLRRLVLRHVRPDGSVGDGELVVAASFADAIGRVFGRLYRQRFPITSMRLMHAFGGSDDDSMAVDNTSAFNCRPITGGKGWSEHSYGRAIDINPLRNPYLRGSLVLPPAGRSWTDRRAIRPGMIVEPGPVVGAFAAIGWSWGGHWARPVDLQHLSSTGK